MKNSQPFPQNTEIDMIAITLAKMELGANANLHCVLALAQDIKVGLLSKTEDHKNDRQNSQIPTKAQ